MVQNVEFMKAVESKLTAAVGASMAQSILKNNLAKLKKDIKSLTEDDCKVLIEDIIKAVALLETKEESKSLKAELEGLLETAP